MTKGEFKMKQEKKRGCCATGYFICSIISCLMNIFYNIIELNSNLETIKSYKTLLMASTVIYILIMVGSILILFWEKIGVYLFLVSVFINIVLIKVFPTNYSSVQTTIISLSSMFFICLITLGLIKPVWKYFD